MKLSLRSNPTIKAVVWLFTFCILRLINYDNGGHGKWVGIGTAFKEVTESGIKKNVREQLKKTYEIYTAFLFFFFFLRGEKERGVIIDEHGTDRIKYVSNQSTLCSGVLFKLLEVSTGSCVQVNQAYKDVRSLDRYFYLSMQRKPIVLTIEILFQGISHNVAIVTGDQPGVKGSGRIGVEGQSAAQIKVTSITHFEGKRSNVVGIIHVQVWGCFDHWVPVPIFAIRHGRRKGRAAVIEKKVSLTTVFGCNNYVAKSFTSRCKEIETYTSSSSIRDPI